jgi:putative ABC transport system ATP-binding protein
MSAAPSPEPILQIERLTKCFRNGDTFVEAVRAVNLTVARGEFAAVMGASGSGKSTLLHLAAGLTRPDEGVVRIEGTDINALDDYALTVFRRKHIGLVFQSFNLIPSLTGRENIVLPMLLGGGARDAGRVDPLIARLGLEGVRDRHPDAMSGGEQQRVSIGRALASSPSLILADEPTGSLDSVNGRKLCAIFRELCRDSGVTVLMVTHNPVVAFAASRFIILKDGRLAGQFDKTHCPTVQDLNQAYLDILEAETAGQEVVA